ncbi:MAG: gamma-glutamyl-gamma-aminobutyrate hydrolase family protein [Alphaproteobacteria bacterium]|nr:gamma-glutamyl-gamma-aminobutyrate hydrolase family protein [Alphaproteobacteria bacterium]
MTRRIAITQRVDVLADRGERRDALDQRWTSFLAACGGLVIPVPNRAPDAAAWAEALGIQSVLLSGGEDLADLGGPSPERDATEIALLAWAERRRVPVLAVCRGLQLLAYRAGARLRRLEGHIAVHHNIVAATGPDHVNSFHSWGFDEVPRAFRSLATAEDGSIEAMRHESLPITGIMWHPERCHPFREADVDAARRALEGRR